MNGTLLLAALAVVVGFSVAGALMTFDWAWARFVDPRVERHYARRNGWPADWLRQEQIRLGLREPSQDPAPADGDNPRRASGSSEHYRTET